MPPAMQPSTHLPTHPAAALEATRGREGRRTWLLVLASFVLCALPPLSGVTPLGDLSGVYTDHVRQPYATWVGLQRGPVALYTRPLGELLEGVEYPQAIVQWLEVPYVYPPGALLLFTPLAVVGKWVPLSQQAFGQLCILFLLGLSHLAFREVLRMLEGQPRGARWVVAVLAWLVLVRLGLQGQYDGAWLLCGVLALRRLQEGRDVPALGWVAAAALLHYRALILLAPGAVALVRAVRGRPLRRWPWGTLAWVVAVGVLDVASFTLMAPLASRTGAATPPLTGEPLAAAGVLLGSLAALWLAWRGADGMVAASVAVGCALAFVDTQHWWHAALLLLVPLSVGVLRRPRWPAAARASLIGWAVLLQVLVWHGNPLWLFRDLNRFLRMLG